MIPAANQSSEIAHTLKSTALGAQSRPVQRPTRGRHAALSALVARAGDRLAVDAGDGDLAADETIGTLGFQTAAIVVVAANVEERDRLVRGLAGRFDTVLLGAPRTEAPSVERGGLRIDRDGHRVTVNGEEVWLTKMEFKLLVALVDRKDRVLDRETLLSDVWGVSAQNKTRTVDTHIQRLRDKLRAAGGFIEGVRGVGYRFSETPKPSPIRRSVQGSADHAPRRSGDAEPSVGPAAVAVPLVSAGADPRR